MNVLMKEQNLDKTSEAPLYGLVMAGGHSERMGRPKGGLTYDRQPQVRRVFQLLDEFCPSVFVSIRNEQKERSWCKDLPRIHDLFQEMGPISGVLSAMIKHPNAAWLTVACDMPFLGTWTLRSLQILRAPGKVASVCKHPETGFLEPLCAIYEPDFQKRIFAGLKQKNESLRKILRESSVRIVQPPNGVSLTSIDTKADREQILQLISFHQSS